MDPKSPRRLRMENFLNRTRSSSSSLVSAVTNRPNLCERCQKIDVSIMRRGGLALHGTPSQITSSAEAGCSFCCLLEQNFDLGPERPIRLRGVRRTLSLQEKVALVEEGDIEGLKVLNATDRDDNPFAHKLTFYTTHDDLAASSIARRPFIKDFASDESFHLIKSWIDNCVYHHPGCNSPVISQLPTRVLDVGVRGGHQDPILFTPPKGYKDSYVALSYCWGDTGSKYVLTKSHSQISKPHFPFNSLPRTIRDAVEITRKLGFRFLWIDALCIIQEGDGGEDFQKESATMHQVYGNAALTIGAAASKSVHEGIFQKPEYIEPLECKIPYNLSGSATGTAFVEFEDIEKGMDRIKEPLNTRAWTFQERILSPRLVLFYKDQISWDCTSRLINSNGPLNPILKRNKDTPGRYSDFISTHDPITRQVESSSDYMVYWKNSIEFYTRRSIKNPTDRLKAITGIAQLIHSKVGDKYCAGMWQSDLHQQLFWYSEDPYRAAQKEHIAPSWSWASISGYVRFELNVVSGYATPESYGEISADLRSPTDSFGDVSEARLTIRGRLRAWPRSFEAMVNNELKLGILKSKLEDASLDALMCLSFDNPTTQKNFFDHTKNSGYFLFHPLGPPFSRNCSLELETNPALLLVKVGSQYQRVGIYIPKWHIVEIYYDWRLGELMRGWDKEIEMEITII